MVSSISSFGRGFSPFSGNSSSNGSKHSQRPSHFSPTLALNIDNSRATKDLKGFLKSKEVERTDEIKAGKGDGLVVNVLQELTEITKNIKEIDKAISSSKDPEITTQLLEKGERYAKNYNDLIKSNEFKRAKRSLIEAENYRDKLDKRDDYLVDVQRRGIFDGSMLAHEMSQGNFAIVSSTRHAFERLEETRISFQGGLHTTYFRRNENGDVNDLDDSSIDQVVEGIGEVEAIISDALKGLTGEGDAGNRANEAGQKAHQSVVEFISGMKGVETSAKRALLDIIDPQENRGQVYKKKPLHVIA